MSKDAFRQVTWDDLETWVGSRTLSKGRSYTKQVSYLCHTPTSGLIAWVQGTHRYATRVEYDDDLSGECSCPVGTECKIASLWFYTISSYSNKRKIYRSLTKRINALIFLKTLKIMMRMTKAKHDLKQITKEIQNYKIF